MEFLVSRERIGVFCAAHILMNTYCEFVQWTMYIYAQRLTLQCQRFSIKYNVMEISWNAYILHTM